MSNQAKNIMIDLDLHTKLKIEAIKRGVTLKELINELLENAIKEIRNEEEMD